jgi:hypothetical protein
MCGCPAASRASEDTAKSLLPLASTVVFFQLEPSYHAYLRALAV